MDAGIPNGIVMRKRDWGVGLFVYEPAVVGPSRGLAVARLERCRLGMG